MDFFRFIFSRKFLKHLVSAILIFIVLIWGVFLFLRFYTKHGQYLTVPGMTGLTIEQARGNADFGNFELVVIDSVYDPSHPRGTILHQDPPPGSEVKKNRTIYLSVVTYVPEKTSMPDLRFLTFRQAISILQSCGLKTGKINYIRTFDEDAVQQQFFNGDIIEPGTKIDKGSSIDLTLGMGSKGQFEELRSGADSTGKDTLNNDLF